ncbi:hypothetical protein [Actinacidiphila sp. bgisy160]|uniref:hypothetical protein n=1 Tax=Actinacidiphila sp. bgisy160 TaxID=3413796 RepID=UPI003D764E50
MKVRCEPSAGEVRRVSLDGGVRPDCRYRGAGVPAPYSWKPGRRRRADRGRCRPGPRPCRCLTGAVTGLATVLATACSTLDGRLPAFGGAALLATPAAMALVRAALAFPVRAESRVAPAHLPAVR